MIIGLLYVYFSHLNLSLICLRKKMELNRMGRENSVHGFPTYSPVLDSECSKTRLLTFQFSTCGHFLALLCHLVTTFGLERHAAFSSVNRMEFVRYPSLTY